MLVTEQRPVCKTPDLCIIACPYNRVLTDLCEPACELPLSSPDGEDSAMEIVFADSPPGEESS